MFTPQRDLLYAAGSPPNLSTQGFAVLVQLHLHDTKCRSAEKKAYHVHCSLLFALPKSAPLYSQVSLAWSGRKCRNDVVDVSID